MSNSFADQVIAQIELYTKHEEYNNDVYMLPKILDEKVAKVHVLALGGELTRLTKDQAEYIGVDVEGLFKPNPYHY
jgi:adenosylhomocysteinase